MPARQQPITALLAVGHPLFRDGMRGALDGAGVRVVGEARDEASALRAVRRLVPDLVVLDLELHGSALRACRSIHRERPDARILMIGTAASAEETAGALAAGARGYMSKESETDELLAAVRLLCAGSAVFPADTLPAVRTRAAQGPAPSSIELSERELQIIGLIVQGADNARIGEELSISPHTVKRHLTNVFEKLGVRTRVEAAVYAVRHGLA